MSTFNNGSFDECHRKNRSRPNPIKSNNLGLILFLAEPNLENADSDQSASTRESSTSSDDGFDEFNDHDTISIDSDPWGSIEDILSRGMVDTVSIAELLDSDIPTTPEPSDVKRVELVFRCDGKTTQTVLVPMTLFENELSQDSGEEDVQPSVRNRLLGTLKQYQDIPMHKGSDWKVLKMVSRIRLNEYSVLYEGFMYHSGIALVSAALKDKILHLFRDPSNRRKQTSYDLRLLLSLRNEGKQKFSNGMNLHCFKIVMGHTKAGTGGCRQNSISDWLITNKNSGCVKFLSQSHIFAVPDQTKRNEWMTKMVQSLTDVFPVRYLDEMKIAGWCYTKKCVSSDWSGAWILLTKRTLYIYSDQRRELEQLDLRKARCVDLIQPDESIGNLCVETGRILFVVCPPHNALYCIMGTPKETHNWKRMIEQSAYENGETFDSQQLTEDGIPVLIEKCLNFIYSHGCRSEGIYRKSGSCIKINNILQLFKENAFAVQLVRDEYSEHDVAGALRRFIRNSQSSVFGNYSVSFVVLAKLSSVDEKLPFYKELLSRLTTMEYNILKKLIGHLKFIASQEQHNKMGVANLATIWGSSLVENSGLNESTEVESHHVFEASMVRDLINHYTDLFPVSREEETKEQLMLNALEKLYAVGDERFSPAKAPEGLQMWVKIDCNNGSNREDGQEKPLVSVSLSASMTASDICKQLAGKTDVQWYNLTLFEEILDGQLWRPIHYRDQVLPVVQRWSQWGDPDDRKQNHLALRRSIMVDEFYRYIGKLASLNPTTELSYADQRTKVPQKSRVQLIGQHIVVSKESSKVPEGWEEMTKINLNDVYVYYGQESRRNQIELPWTITLVERAFGQRTREAPFVGHLLGGSDIDDQLLWYSCIWYSLCQEDIF